MLRTFGLSSFFAVSAVSAVGLTWAPARPAWAAAPQTAPAPAARPPAQKEPAITVAGPSGDYLRRVHERLHGRWTENFVKTVAATHPPTHALNDLGRVTTVAATIRWDGTLAELVTTRSSGAPEFDRAAIDVVRKSAPYPLPPADVVSDDTYAHVEWTFARDHRACGAGAAVVRVDDPLEVSLPRLVQVNRIGEALRRVGDALKGGKDAGLDRFARLYLGRNTGDSVVAAAASLALAEAGDRAQAGRLREALAARQTMELGVRGLRKLGVDVCEATRDAMTTGRPAARELAIAAVRMAARDGADVGACLPALSALAADGTQPAAARVAALDAIGTLMPASARPVVMGLLEDKDPAVRGVALLASVRKGAGRPEMYRLAPMLHDKAVEVRAAASAGIVRAAGDTALDQLYLLARETDPRPAQGVAAELAQMNSKVSAEFLGKMLKRNNVAVQLAAARALTARKDAGARAELEAAKADDRLPGDVLAVVTGQAKPDGKTAAALAATGGGAAIEPVRALLKEHRNAEAAAWIVEKLPALEDRDSVAVLGAWLVRDTSAPAASRPAAPAASRPAAPAEQAPVAAPPAAEAPAANGPEAAATSALAL